MFGNTGVTLDKVNNLISAAIAGLPAGLQYVGNGAPMLVADVLTNYPAGSAYNNMYANVTDLYNMGTGSGLTEVLRCRYDNVNNMYRWIPQRQEFNRTLAATGGTTTLSPLVTPPTVILNGTLISNLTVAPTATNAWVGQRFRIIQNSTLGVLTTTLTGLVGSNITLLGNAEQVMEFTAAGWRSMNS